jgi:hypothetical protein
MIQCTIGHITGCTQSEPGRFTSQSTSDSLQMWSDAIAVKPGRDIEYHQDQWGYIKWRDGRNISPNWRGPGSGQSQEPSRASTFEADPTIESNRTRIPLLHTLSPHPSIKKLRTGGTHRFGTCDRPVSARVSPSFSPAIRSRPDVFNPLSDSRDSNFQAPVAALSPVVGCEQSPIARQLPR